MSNIARTPESYAAWQRIKHNQAIRPEEEPWVAIQQCSDDLDFLADYMLDSPTPARLEAFFKRGFELSQLAEQSVARTEQSFHDQDLCEADIRAAQEENSRLEARNQRLLEYVHTKSVVVAQKRSVLKKMEQQYAENERLIASLGIPVRRDSQGHPICECDQCGTQC